MKISLLLPQQSIDKKISQLFSWADEAVIYTSFISKRGYEMVRCPIKKFLGKKKKVTVIFSYDFNHTSPEAIRKMFKDKINLFSYSDLKLFHPKLYYFKKNNGRAKFIIGSSNFTQGGFRDNIELNLLISDLSRSSRLLIELQKEINRIKTSAREVRLREIEDYQKKYNRIQRVGRKYMAAVIREKKTIEKIQKRLTLNWNELIKKAKQFKESKHYRNSLCAAPKRITKIKKLLDFPNFRSLNAESWRNLPQVLCSNLDRRTFNYSIPKSTQELNRLKRTLRHLLNEKIEISERIKDVVYVGGDYHIYGLGINAVSEILNAFYPHKYIILNKPIEKALRKFGYHRIPNAPEVKYLAICDVYSEIKKRAGYSKKWGYALLDTFMWRIGHKLLYGWA